MLQALLFRDPSFSRPHIDGKVSRRLTVSEYMLVKCTLLTQFFRLCSRASARRANWHIRGTLAMAISIFLKGLFIVEYISTGDP